jgi:PRC-barrel domain
MALMVPPLPAASRPSKTGYFSLTSWARGMLPADAATVADYYKQKVYDPADEKIGEIVDLIIEKSGYVPAVIIAVSGFLGIIGTKYVAVPFAALQVNQKEHKEHIVLDTNKRALKNAPTFEYNRSTKHWERVEE